MARLFWVMGQRYSWSKGSWCGPAGFPTTPTTHFLNLAHALPCTPLLSFLSVAHGSASFLCTGLFQITRKSAACWEEGGCTENSRGERNGEGHCLSISQPTWCLSQAGGWVGRVDRTATTKFSPHSSSTCTRGRSGLLLPYACSQSLTWNRKRIREPSEAAPWQHQTDTGCRA